VNADNAVNDSDLGVDARCRRWRRFTITSQVIDTATPFTETNAESAINDDSLGS